MRVLVTGAGLLGAHTADELLRAGHEVVLVDLRPDPRYLACVVTAGRPDLLRLDARDMAGLLRLMGERRIDTVVHTVGLLGPKAGAHPYLAFQVNGAASATVAEAARRAGAARLVHLSSLAVYGWPPAVAGPLVDESTPTAPTGPYGASKLAGELAARCYGANGWLRVAVLRLAGVYGPGLFGGGAVLGRLVQRAVAGAIAGGPVAVPAELSGHEYLHAGDAAAAVRLTLDAGLSGVYNVGTGRVYGAPEVADALTRAVPGVTVTGAAPDSTVPRAGEPAAPPPALDTRRFRRDVPGWTCRALPDGLTSLAATLRDHPWLCQPTRLSAGRIQPADAQEVNR